MSTRAARLVSESSQPDEGFARPALAPLLVTVEQAATLLAVGRTTIYELMWRDELIPIRIGRSVRLSVEQLQDFIRRRTDSID